MLYNLSTGSSGEYLFCSPTLDVDVLFTSHTSNANSSNKSTEPSRWIRKGKPTSRGKEDSGKNPWTSYVWSWGNLCIWNIDIGYNLPVICNLTVIGCILFETCIHFYYMAYLKGKNPSYVLVLYSNATFITIITPRDRIQVARTKDGCPLHSRT